jgi:hypothetical protein
VHSSSCQHAAGTLGGHSTRGRSGCRIQPILLWAAIRIVDSDEDRYHVFTNSLVKGGKLSSSI